MLGWKLNALWNWLVVVIRILGGVALCILLLALVACCSPCFSPQLFEGDSGDRAVQPFLALLAAALNLLVPQLHQKDLQVMTTVTIGGARLLAYDTVQCLHLASARGCTTLACLWGPLPLPLWRSFMWLCWP